MKRELENDRLRIVIEDKGAEIISIYDKKEGREDLWQALPPYWNRQSPVLFPNVGKYYKNVYRLNKKIYTSSQHGFARDMVFTCEKQTSDSLTYKISDDEETRKKFPFSFELFITYTLEENKITISWTVSNQGNETMYFTIGGHPGFNTPILPDTKQTDYYLMFRKGPELQYKLLDKETGTVVTDREYTLQLEPAGDYYVCPITEHMFDKDALVFDDSQISWAAIGYPDKTPYISMECGGFTNFGIWTMPGGPYVCLEPWMGRCDDYGYEGEISKKQDVTALEAGKIFKADYSIILE